MAGEAWNQSSSNPWGSKSSGGSWSSDPYESTKRGVADRETAATNRARIAAAAAINSAYINSGGLWGEVQRAQKFDFGRQLAKKLQGGFGSNPLFSPQQIQEQVNARRAAIDSSTATQQRQAAQAAGGRGFSGSSPLLLALQSQIGGRGMAAGFEGEQAVRTSLARENAEERGKQMSYLLQALGSFV